MPYERVDDLSGETDDDQAIEAPLGQQTVGEQRVSVREAIKPIFQLLGKRDREIIEYMFGTEHEPASSHTIEETATHFGMTTTEVRALRARILETIQSQGRTS